MGGGQQHAVGASTRRAARPAVTVRCLLPGSVVCSPENTCRFAVRLLLAPIRAFVIAQPDNTDDLFDVVLHRVENDMSEVMGQHTMDNSDATTGATLVRKALVLLYCARYGLREIELLELLAPPPAEAVGPWPRRNSWRNHLGASRRAMRLLRQPRSPSRADVWRCQSSTSPIAIYSGTGRCC